MPRVAVWGAIAATVIGGAIAVPVTAAPANHQYVIEELAKPEYAGRQAGTEGYARAVTYIEGQMRDVGMLPVVSETSYRIPYTASTAVLQRESVVVNGVTLRIGVDYQPFARSIAGTWSASGAYYAGDGLAADYPSSPIRGMAIFHWDKADGTFGGGIQDRVAIAQAHGATSTMVILDGELQASNFEHPLLAEQAAIPGVYISKEAALRAGIPNNHHPATVSALAVSCAMQIERNTAAQASDLIGVIPGRQEDHAILWLTNIDSFGTLPDGRSFAGAAAGSAAAAMMLDLASAYKNSQPEFTQLFAFVGSKWTDKAGTTALAKRLYWSHIDAVLDLYAMGDIGTQQSVSLGYTDPSMADAAKAAWGHPYYNGELGNGLSSKLLAYTKRAFLVRDQGTWIDDSMSDLPSRISAQMYSAGLATLTYMGSAMQQALNVPTSELAAVPTFEQTTIGTAARSVYHGDSQYLSIYVDPVDAGKMTLPTLQAMDRVYNTVRFYNYDVTVSTKPTALFISDGQVAADVCRRSDLSQHPEVAGGGFASTTSDYLCIYQRRSGTGASGIFQMNIAHEFNHAAANAMTYYGRAPELQEWQGQSHFVRVSQSSGLPPQSGTEMVRLITDFEVPLLPSLIANYKTDIDWRWFTDNVANPVHWQYTYHVAGSQYAFLADQYGTRVSRRAIYRNYADVTKYKENLTAETGLSWDVFCERWSYWMLHSGQALVAVDPAVRAQLDRNTSYDYMLLFTRPEVAPTNSSGSGSSSASSSGSGIGSDGTYTLKFAGTAASDITAARFTVTQTATEYILGFAFTSGIERRLVVFIAPNNVLGIYPVHAGANTLQHRIAKSALAAGGQLMLNFLVDDSNRAFFPLAAGTFSTAPQEGQAVVTPTASAPTSASATPTTTGTPTPSPAVSSATPEPSASPTPAASPAPTETVQPTPTPSSSTVAPKPATSAASKVLKTIRCIKGKTVKKVTAIKPVCPKGWTKV